MFGGSLVFGRIRLILRPSLAAFLYTYSIKSPVAVRGGHSLRDTGQRVNKDSRPDLSSAWFVVQWTRRRRTAPQGRPILTELFNDFTLTVLLNS